MATVAEKKQAQGYTEKPGTCATCDQYTSKVKYPEWVIEMYGAEEDIPSRYSKVESHRRCGIGGFAIKVRAKCNFWKLREVDE